MPNLLKKLFRPSLRPQYRTQDPTSPLDLISSPTQSHADNGREPEIDDLSRLAQKVLGGANPEGSRSRSRSKSGSSKKRSMAPKKGTSEYLADQVESQLYKRAEAEAAGKKGEKVRKAKKTVLIEPAAPAVARWVGDDGQKVMNTIIESLGMMDQLQTDGLEGEVSDKLLGRCTHLLEVQRDEMKDIVVHMERERYPALRTLRQVYERVLSGLTGLEDLEPSQSTSELATLVQLLEEGPDYLIDTFLIELVIHHAETLDSTLASEIRDIYKNAVSQPGDLGTFRKAAQGIVAYACAIPQEDLDDEVGRDAYRAIGVLVKQLKVRVDGDHPESRGASTITSSNTSQSQKSILKVSTPAPVSPAPSSDDELETLGASTSQSRYGTGPILPSPALPSMVASSIGTPDDPIPMSVSASREKGKTKAPPSAGSSTSSLDSISLYDYRGQILTASALDLVLRQETLALADSTGQYAGEVSWDDVRKAWIPHWVVKLQPGDLAPGEIPSTNPADFEVRDEDEFGNKIGFTDTGEMYFEEEPIFELK